MDAYVVIKTVNESIKKYNQIETKGRPQFTLNTAKSDLYGDIEIAREAINKAIKILQSALREH